MYRKEDKGYSDFYSDMLRLCIRREGDTERRGNDGNFVIDLAALIYLLLLLSGSIAAGAFTVTLGIICAVRHPARGRD